MPKTTSQRSPPRIIVGIDPGVAIVGYAFVRELRGVLTLLACDVIRTPSKMPLEDRLLSIYKQMDTLLTVHHPTDAAMETLFFGKNKKTAMQVAHARGVLLLALSQHGIPIAEYGPTEVKLALTGYGSGKPATGRRDGSYPLEALDHS
jgi:crossover junction endodeoxyribonuclease RuvC